MSCKRVLVFGGRGALGSTCLKHFKSKGLWVCSVDFSENSEADANILVSECDTCSAQEKLMKSDLNKVLNNQKLDGIFCVAGGWVGGNAAHRDFLENCDVMWKKCVWSSSIAASLASSHLSTNGLLLLTGAHAALQATPGMLAYGMAKAAVHQLTRSLAGQKSGLPDGACVIAISPITLDTPMNRKWMPKADHTTWTPTETVAELCLSWLEDVDSRPQSGSIIQLITKDNKTECIPV
ncbi:unnamed protein product [Trichobilharzia szidati]|nr:unnamed protein product [Trichobilharzia szidati]CAH8842747.1 unnamed protein product [Trichobilharzia szidati]CAH8842876.1 unnamed protein product [Trichobilharzia szidati]